MPDLAALEQEARRLAAEHRWDEAALAFARLATLCGRVGHGGVARAWEAAGEAWRRADRPAAAARALREAIVRDPEAWTVRIKLAGALSDAGELGRAEATCRRVLAMAEGPEIRAIAADTAIGVLEARGLLGEARALLADLPEDADPLRGAARWFRQGQLDRMEGRLVDAAMAMGRVIAGLEGIAGAEVGVAGARGELAEVALLRGDHAEAIEFFTESVDQHRATGRRSLELRAQAGRVRAMVEAGVQPFGHDLDDGVPWAQGRSLRVLEIDLLLARGMARAAADPAGGAADLDAAARLADAHQMPLRSGRARYERATRVPSPPKLRRELLEQSLRDLAPSAPLAARASLALARAWADADPGRARVLAVRASARFSAMGLEEDARSARDVLHQLP